MTTKIKKTNSKKTKIKSLWKEYTKNKDKSISIDKLKDSNQTSVLF